MVQAPGEGMIYRRVWLYIYQYIAIITSMIEGKEVLLSGHKVCP